MIIKYFYQYPLHMSGAAFLFVVAVQLVKSYPKTTFWVTFLIFQFWLVTYILTLMGVGAKP